MAGNHKGGGIQQLMLAHCEKVATAVIVMIAGYLIYASLGVESEQRDPASLGSAVQQTKLAYDQAPWPSAEEDPEGEFTRRSYDMPSDIVARIPTDPYIAEGRGLSRPVVPPTVDRSDPTLLAATDLEGTALTGIFALESEQIRQRRELEALREQQEEEKRRRENREQADENSRGGGGYDRTAEAANKNRRPVGSRVREAGVPTQGDEQFERVSCAVVLAKLPVSDQYRIYKEALEDARGYNPSSDVPEYVALYVERAEVQSASEEAEDLNWEPVKVGSLVKGPRFPALYERSLDEMLAEWPGGQEPMMDARYEHPILTMPLPPLVGQDWGVDVVHSEVPLQAETDALEAKKANEPLDDAPVGEPGEVDFFSSRGGVGGREGRTSRRSPRGGARGGYGEEGGGFGGPGREFSEGRSGSRSAGRSRGGRGGSNFSIDTPFQMVRFFDCTVAPGRLYRYRVQLVLRDVNYGVQRNFLGRDVLARQAEKPKSKTRRTEWSEPSKVISVPLAGEVLVAGAKISRRPGAEGSAKLLVRSYSLDENDRAVKAGVEKDFQRGDVMNLTDDAEFVTPDRRWIEKADSFEFRTGVTLCDFRGGEELAKDVEAPVSVLLMDATGKLFVRNQLDDAGEVENHRLIFEETDVRGGGRGGDYGSPGGYGGERGGYGLEFSPPDDRQQRQQARPPIAAGLFLWDRG